ncbi:ABC transporter permease [Rhodoferax koreense]|uniref:ABC transporter permease n=1 Tax=Rhodoferax koreensis TaxID=1842727 RepID=UPI001EF53E2E|nr:ABC transporter permease [Rhodoferax koreense]
MIAKNQEYSGGAWRNPHASQSVSLWLAARSLWASRRLLGQLSLRELTARYKGSVLGFAWTFVVPMFMLVVYTFVFSEVFKARWDAGSATESKGQFAIILFAGTIVLQFFNEVLARAPHAIIQNANFVKKVVFPLEILPVVSVVVSAVNAVASGCVLLFVQLLLTGSVPWTAVLFPVVLLPLFVLSLGVAWSLAALGVYLRGLAPLMGMVAAVLMFLSPVFYPVSAVPPGFQRVLMLNPLTFVIEQARRVAIMGHLPDWTGLAIYAAASLAFAACGFALFQKTRKGFADVL